MSKSKNVRYEHFTIEAPELEGHGYVIEWLDGHSVGKVGDAPIIRERYGFELHITSSDGWVYDVKEWGYYHQEAALNMLLSTLKKLSKAYEASVYNDDGIEVEGVSFGIVVDTRAKQGEEDGDTDDSSRTVGATAISPE